MGVVYVGEMVKDFCDFADAFIDGISREGNVPNRRAEQMKPGTCGAWNSAVERVISVERRDVVAAPDGRFGGVEVEAK